MIIKFLLVLVVVSIAVYCYRYFMEDGDKIDIKFGLKETLSSVVISGVILSVISFLNNI